MNTDDKPSVLIQTDHHSCYRGCYISQNRPDISAVECCNRACVFPCVDQPKPNCLMPNDFTCQGRVSWQKRVNVQRKLPWLKQHCRQQTRVRLTPQSSEEQLLQIYKMLYSLFQTLLQSPKTQLNRTHHLPAICPMNSKSLKVKNYILFQWGMLIIF